MHQCYVCGGAVRDVLLQLQPKDVDFVWTGTTPNKMLERGFQLIEATNFPVFLDKNGDEHALARTEKKTGKGYHGFDVNFDPSITIEEDLIRRDITINSLAVRVEDWKEFQNTLSTDLIIDPYNGIQHLNSGILQHTSVAFQEDVTRVLRVARFKARYNFEIAPITMKLMTTLVSGGELDHLVPERIWIELTKAMGEDQPHLFFSTLEDCGAMQRLFPGVMIAQSIKRHIAMRLQDCTVMERLMMVFVDSPISLLKKLKAPTNVQRLTKKLQQVVETRDTLVSTELLLDFLKSIDAYRNTDELTSVLSTAGFYDFTLSCHIMSIEAALKATKDIGFDSLLKENQDNLTGKEIGEAIDKLRLTAIEST